MASVGPEMRIKQSEPRRQSKTMEERSEKLINEDLGGATYQVTIRSKCAYGDRHSFDSEYAI